MQSNDKLEACTDFSKMGCIITKKKKKEIRTWNTELQLRIIYIL